jgi:hypothetical protein
MTSLAPVRLNTRVEWNELKHLPVKIYPRKSDPRNNIHFCLMSHLGFEDHKFNIVGSTFLNLHSILKSKCTSVLVDLTTLQTGYGSLVVGELELEVCMSYGMFGFGDSHQLVFKDCVPESYLHRSFFPRIEVTTEERTDANGLFRTCCGNHVTLIYTFTYNLIGCCCQNIYLILHSFHFKKQLSWLVCQNI